jgi:hypothetical protein
MKGPLRIAFEAELAAAAAAAEHRRRMHHLSRAHILSQRFTWPHVRVHTLMLRAGIQARDAREVLGQLTRIVAAALFSRIWVPAGNTGLAEVSALRPMPVPEDLRALLEEGKRPA